MLLFQNLLLALSLSETVVEGANSPRLTVRGSKPRTASTESRLAARQPEATVIDKREPCPPGTRFLYVIPGRNPPAQMCLGIYAYATCSILILSASAIFSSIALTTSKWVKEQKRDESSAGPQSKKRDDEDLLTWGQLYNYTKSVGKNRIEGKEAAAYVNDVSTSRLGNSSTTTYSDPTSEKAITAAVEPSASTQYITTDLEIHEDGFSASFAPPLTGPLQERLHRCNQQVHVHYWAAAGHESTILSGEDVQNLVEHALDHSYKQDYKAVCYELDNSGNWSGAFRVCYNSNQPQKGCFTCFGHSN